MRMKLSVFLGTLALIRMVLTVAIQWYVIAQLGVSVQTDALVAGYILPQFLVMLMGGSVTQVLVPLLALQDEETLRQSTWAAVSVGGGFLIVLTIGLYHFADSWVVWLVPGFSEVGKLLTIELSRIQIISLIFSACNLILSSPYHARSRFIWVELSPTLSLLLTFLFLIWSLPRFGVYAAAASVVIKAILDFFWLLKGIGRPSQWNWSFALLIAAWRRIWLLWLGSAYYSTEPFVNQVLASLAPTGTLSLFNVAQQFYSIVNQITQRAVAAPALTDLAIAARGQQWRRFRRRYQQALRWLILYVGIGFIALLTLGEPALRLLVGRTNIVESNVVLLWQLLITLMGLFICGTLGQITTASLFALGDTRIVTHLGVVTYTFFIPLKIMAFIWFGVIGVAVSSSIFFAVNLLGQLHFVERLTSGLTMSQFHHPVDEVIHL